MSLLFIIGNGFDIAHGIPTRYSDFREFILKIYPKAEKNSKKVVSLEYLNRKTPEEIAAEFLICAMDVACGKTWADFEDALSRIHFLTNGLRVIMRMTKMLIENKQQIICLK